MGINYRIKAHYVINFLLELKRKIITQIAVTSGCFADERKYCFVDIRSMLMWILKGERYAGLLADRDNVGIF